MKNQFLLSCLSASLFIVATVSHAEKQPLLDPFAMPSSTDKTTLAFVDSSKVSLAWLDDNHTYFIENKIPIMLIGGSEAEAKRLNQVYGGLLIGPAPKPKAFVQLLMKQLNVTSIPAVVENGVVWQYGDR